MEQAMEVYEHLKRKAARLSKFRYVCFTKVWLCTEFAVMNESNCLDEIVAYFDEQPLGSRRESPRLIFDQLSGTVIHCHNEELVLQTLEILKQEDLRLAHYHYPFQVPSRIWNVDNYLQQQIGGEARVGTN
ncbi:hypothetical protein [Paenibacillus taichungensis]